MNYLQKSINCMIYQNNNKCLNDEIITMQKQIKEHYRQINNINVEIRKKQNEIKENDYKNCIEQFGNHDYDVYIYRPGLYDIFNNTHKQLTCKKCKHYYEEKM